MLATRRRTILSIGIAMLSGCERKDAAPIAESIRVGIIGTSDELPLFVMQETGIAARRGLLIAPTAFAGGAAIIDELAAGRVDVAPSIGTVPLLRAALGGPVPDRLVAVSANSMVTPQTPFTAVLVAPSIKNWKDLEGQAVAVHARNSLNAAALTVRLAREGVGAVRLIEIPLPNQGLALAGGHVVAAVVSEPFIAQSLARGDGRVLDWIFGGPPLERGPPAVLAASREFMIKQPELLARFLRAHLDAARWIEREPQEARAILAKRLGMPAERTASIVLPLWPTDGRIDPVLMDAMQTVLLEGGVLAQRVPLERVYDSRPLEAVLSAGAR
jgi:NitT/TauT family transport system substrate-binding protein